MDRPTFIEELQASLPRVIPTERPLPPTPVDDVDSTTSQQGEGQTVIQPSSHDNEYESDEENSERATPEEWRGFQKRGSARYRKRHAGQQQLEAAAEAERQTAASEGSSPRRVQEEAESNNSFGRADLGILDIYGSSGDEGARYGDVASRTLEGTSISAGNRTPNTPRRYCTRSAPRHSVYAGDGNQDRSSSGGELPLLPGALPSHTRRRPSIRTEVVVPRWQPDAEVTFCPICRTQFSFFVRKHHCRRCGRVVCNSCSPHRITIPYQYIVQPPSETASSVTRPSVDAARAGSSVVVASLGGGERVRLCNPCVPDPNIAPPQTRSDGQPSQQQGHIRSVSSAAASYSHSGRGSINHPNFKPRARQPSILGIPAYQVQNRASAASINAAQERTSASYSGQNDSHLRPEGLDSRSRSSTVGSTRENPNMGINQSRPSPDLSSMPYSRPYHSLVPRSEANLSRPLPNTPQSQSQTQHTRHRRIPEEDECWVCHQELPSRSLPNFEALREAHTGTCVQAAIDGTNRSTPPNNVSVSVSASGHITRNRNTTSAATEASSSSSPVPNTPEARTAARERDHAAVVLGQSQVASGSPGTMSRVIPYISSEKDCVDDAECTICLEEFEVGQAMGRLECFCRYHMECIQGWFEKKPGKCPVHGVIN